MLQVTFPGFKVGVFVIIVMHEESTHKVVYLSDDRSALEKAGDHAGRAGDRREEICVQGNRLTV